MHTENSELPPKLWGYDLNVKVSSKDLHIDSLILMQQCSEVRPGEEAGSQGH